MADDMEISSVLDFMDVSTISVSNFSGFPMELSNTADLVDFSGFELPEVPPSFRPNLHSTHNLESILPVQTRSPLFTYDVSSFIGYGDLSNSELSDLIDDVDDSGEHLQNATILPVANVEEPYRDITPPFDVAEGIQGERLMVLMRGTSKGKPCIVYEATGQVLVKNSEHPRGCPTKQTMRCVQYDKNGCKAQVVIKFLPHIVRDRFNDDPDIEWFWLEPNVDYWTTPRLHHLESCRLIPGNVEKLKFLSECRKQALDPRMDGENAMVILRIARAMHCTEDSVGTFFPSDANTCQMINRVRQSIRSRPPKKDKSDILAWTFMLNRLPAEVPENFYRGDTTSVYRRETSRHFIFFNSFQMGVLRDSILLILDATFAVVREPFTQLLTIHAQLKRTNEEGNLNMPVAYVLMMGKAEPAYEAVFKKIRDIVAAEGEPMKVKEFVIDYEKSIWNSLRKVWPESAVRGCWFHYTQCIRRKVIDCKIGKAAFEHGGVHKMERRLMMLPLVDENNIPLLFRRLKSHYQAQIDSCNGVKLLFEYMELMWISGRSSIGFTPKDYSCFEKVIRTTNIAEVWNSEFFTAGKRKKNDIYQLTKLLAKDAAHSEADLLQYAHKKYRKRVQVEKERKIRKANRQYREDGNLWLFMENLRVATKKIVSCNPRGPVTQSDTAE